MKIKDLVIMLMKINDLVIILMIINDLVIILMKHSENNNTQSENNPQFTVQPFNFSPVVNLIETSIANTVVLNLIFSIVPVCKVASYELIKRLFSIIYKKAPTKMSGLFRMRFYSHQQSSHNNLCSPAV